MPGFDRIERGFNPDEIILSAETELSLRNLMGRLDTLTNESLSSRQAEIYYEGARHMKDNLERFPQYQQYTGFIEKIIKTYEESLPTVEVA